MTLNFKKIAKSLGLKNVEGEIPGEKTCGDCNGALRLGEEKKEKVTEKIFAYCPQCRKKVCLVFEGRFPPGIKVGSHDD